MWGGCDPPKGFTVQTSVQIFSQISCSQLHGEELEKCILQDLESSGFGAFIPLTAKVLLDSVSCPESSENGGIGQETLEESLGPFDKKGFENLSQIHRPNLSDCSFEFANVCFS